MIDWVTVSIPYPHSTPINGGNVVSILPTGEEDWRIEKRLQVRGSFLAFRLRANIRTAGVLTLP